MQHHDPDALPLHASLALALQTLLAFGYGSISAYKDADGQLRYDESELTVKPKQGESGQMLAARLAPLMQPGDELRIDVHGYEAKLARIVRRPQGA